MAEGSSPAAAMSGVLAKQKAAHLRDGVASAKVRLDRLDRCIRLLIDYQPMINKALTADFGSRPAAVTGIADVAASIGPLKHAKAHLETWMKPERRPTTPAILSFLGAKAELRWQPKGVVGVISPWNFPVNLTFSPLAGILAAGNRAMIKPSEYTPATSQLMAEMFAETFSDEEISVVIGGPEVGEAFTRMAFDHLIFTGATSVAKHVMRAAAENLVPVTLELGGKSPVILGRTADLPTAAARIMAGKTLNAGQICLAPDYVLAPEDRISQFVDEARRSVQSMFPTIRDNPDYTAVIADRHYDRLRSYIEDARNKGAQIVELNPAAEDFSQQEHRKIPPTLVLNPTDEMAVMRDEIFGPILPIKGYRSLVEATTYINAHDRPLAVYYFGSDEAEREAVVDGTTSGGVSVNDVIFHVAQEALPFGGVGASGMGRYHGVDGFREFSHGKAVYRQIKTDIGPLKALRPPYGAAVRKYLASQMRP